MATGYPKRNNSWVLGPLEIVFQVLSWPFDMFGHLVVVLLNGLGLGVRVFEGFRMQHIVQQVWFRILNKILPKDLNLIESGCRSADLGIIGWQLTRSDESVAGLDVWARSQSAAQSWHRPVSVKYD